MKLDPSELIHAGYAELDRLEHKELVPFIRTYMKKWTRFSVTYYLANIIAFGLVGYLFASDMNSPAYRVSDKFTYFSYGLAIAFALVPLHEYIHVLAYKSQGAKNTSYDANIKKFYFMALADKFVANRKEFQVVALAPFITISSILVALLFLVNGNWSLTVAGVLLAHTAMCSGDFGLLSYFEFHKQKEVVTYDDIQTGVSYFFGKDRLLTKIRTMQ
jgi:Putative zincin peptidase